MTERRILTRPYTFEDAKMNDVFDMIFIELGRLYRGNMIRYVELQYVKSIDTNELIVAGVTVTEDELLFLAGLDQYLLKTSDVIFNDLTLTNPSNIYALLHDSFAGFVANEHIDWTDASQNFKTTGDINISGSITAPDITVEDLIVSGTVKAGDGGVTDYIAITNKGVQTFHGDARSLRHLRVGAGSWHLGSSAPTTGFDGVFKYLEFDDTTDDEAHFTLIVPHRWDSSEDIEFCVDWYYTGAQDNGTVCWGLEYKSVKAGEAVTGAGTIIYFTTAGTHATGDMVASCFTAKILAANLEAEDTIGLRLFRDVDGAGDNGDTLTTNARVINTHFHFIQNKLGKAL